MSRKLVRRKEAPEMTKGSLLDTCLFRREFTVPIVFSFNPLSEGGLEPGSVVTSMGKLTGRLGMMCLQCLSARGLCYIRIRNLVKHRPGESVDEEKVIERPRRLSARKGKKREPR